MSVSPFTVVVAKMEVSPQDKMANPQGIKVFAVERHGLPGDFQSSTLVFTWYLPRIMRLCVVRSSDRPRERLCVSCMRSPELSAEVRRESSCNSCTHAQMDACNKHNGKNG